MNFLNKLIQKIRFLSKTELVESSSLLILDKSVEAKLEAGSKIIVEKGIFQLGGPLPMSPEMPSYGSTKIIMDKNSILIIRGNVHIASGTFIHVKENATMVFEGKNFIGHNNIIICSRQISIGLNTSTSWQVTLIDHDGHNLYQQDGTSLKIPYSPLILDDNVGIQMNVTIPRGLRVGKNSLVGPHTILRKNVLENKYIYLKPITSEKDGISAGLQFFT